MNAMKSIKADSTRAVQSEASKTALPDDTHIDPDQFWKVACEVLERRNYEREMAKRFALNPPPVYDEHYWATQDDQPS